MPSRPVRRAQLIAPFGTGSIVVARDGTTLIAAGLDHWFEREDRSADIDPSEFQFSEWRLERELGVDYFALPPEYRRKRRSWWASNANVGITIPFLRFPTWHRCPRCGSLAMSTLTTRETPRCASCEAKPPRTVQVRFVAMCEKGHIQDFPWREWVHRSVTPDCTGVLRLRATGGASLAATKISCACGQSRTLERITEAGSDGADDYAAPSSTYLTRNLAPGIEFVCRGARPWLADLAGTGCGLPLRGSLRGATNVYYAHVKSAIYLPRHADNAPQALVELLDTPPLSTLLRLLEGANIRVTAQLLRQQYGALLRGFSDTEIGAAITAVGTSPTVTATPPTEDEETAFRRAEFASLRTVRRDEQLRTTPIGATEFSDEIARVLRGVTLVEKLRETRVLTGFSRVFPDNAQTQSERRAMLWRSPPHAPGRWLPAYKVYGEGILIELDEQRLTAWEARDRVVARVRMLASRYADVQARRHSPPRSITPRFVLLHTLAHLLMNELTFECGYGSASLRERLYVSRDGTVPMAAVLIYTAAGDSEGTMGGLVRMGRPGNIEPIIGKALQGAMWCSSDPVCMELGDMGGQGPDSCNLAACHNCCLCPETSCEEFNRFLDRGLILGTAEHRDLGYFD